MRNALRGSSMQPMSETASARSDGEPAAAAPEEEEAGGGEESVNVFVAVPEQHKNGQLTLAWALRNLAELAPAAAVDVVVVVAHVHVPPQEIPVMGSKFHASKLREDLVSSYRKNERAKVNKHLKEYIRQCSKMKIKCRTLVIESEDVVKGITELVSLHGASKLVMGAAADKHFPRNPSKLLVPRSKTALEVMRQAHPSCKIWFVCREHLISISEDGTLRSPIPTPAIVPACRSPIPASTIVSARRNRYASSNNAVDSLIQRSMSEKVSPLWLPCRSAIRRTLSILSMEHVSVGSWDRNPRDSVPSSCREEASSDSSSSFELPIDDVFTIHHNTAPCHDDQAKKTEDVPKLKEDIAKVKEDIPLSKEEMEALKREHDDAIRKLSEADEAKAELEQRVVDLMERTSLLDSQLRLAEETRTTGSGLDFAWCSEFSLSELRQATRNFSDDAKVGDGVYRGVLRNTTVAIKMLHSHSSSQFQQEVGVVSRVRHPNLVTLMGCCPEASALVFEFLPNGSLEDRLARRDGTPPLAWQARTRIIGEVCSALVFLHSCEPCPVIHGDLNAANILLDANLVSKLGDYGASRLPTMTDPGSSPYTDPELLITGQLTAGSDVYSFGVVVLRLVTGQPALGIARKVEEALEKGEIEALVDRSAGEWPFAQAEKLMLLGLQCAELSSRRRPARMSQVWRVVEPLAKAASMSVAPESLVRSFGESHMPSYFICPISQEVMRNPHTAADGYTYEAEAIKGWLDSGHETSPMTKMPLVHRHVTPSYALRSAIQNYMQQRQQKMPQ
ncbi:U-box domain-containing protein 33-like [Triticum dicoccoides]|uniref:U-box domain-containing protein 33-like n=1 Tax=Triticum dicoccoides TaxID=85692 RepID=UPI000E78DE1B|nr:U-box domain-containing protein 33-like [Triticum dicoccoides]